MPTTLNSGLQLPDKGSVDWYSSMQNNYNLLDNHLENTNIHVTAEDKANWDSKQGSLSQAQLDAIAQVSTNTSDISALQSGKANASHTHSSSDITDIGDYATKQYVDTSISGLVDNAPDALNTLNELSAALNDDSNFATTVTTALGAKANSADLATVATSGDYDDLSNKPTINDSTITIQKNGSTVDTFTTNGSAKTIDIPVPTKTSDLTNDSDFVVSSSLAAVATSGFYNDLDNKPYIPDKISDLIDDSNFVDTSNPAVASGITSAKVTSYDSHIADTDIHVTTADKATWNTVTSKANDSDVVHKSGNETINGTKTFKNMIPIDGDYLGDEASNNQRTNICLRANRDTAGKSCAYITRFRQNKPQGALQTGDFQMLGFDFLENEVRTTNVFSIQCSGWVDNVPTKIKLLSASSDSTFGSSARPSKINDLNPGSLSFPDLDNGLDISGYITAGPTHNEYTPIVDGWISVILKKTTSSGALAIFLYQGDVGNSYFGNTSLPDESEFCGMASIPVKAGAVVNIDLRGNNIYVYSAKFYPNLGNV